MAVIIVMSCVSTTSGEYSLFKLCHILTPIKAEVYAIMLDGWLCLFGCLSVCMCVIEMSLINITTKMNA